MGKINIGRWLLAGLITGIIIDVVEGVLNGVILASQWVDAFKAINQPPLGLTQIIEFNIFGLMIGFAAAWIYVAIRPRFGAGVKTAVYAALATWVLGYFAADWTPNIMGALPTSMFLVLIVVGFFEIIVATIAGAYFYKEA